jgi:predicted ATPase/DNA-binding SARP family transcriptional activator
VHVGVLGPVEVAHGADVVRIDGLKRRQALAVLIAAGGEPVSEERLIEALWGEEPPVTATATLQSHISRLRSAVRPVPIEATAGGYALDLTGVDLDARRFESLLGQARSTGPARSGELLEALSLWRGAAFGDHAELPGVRGEALRLEELRLVATEEWVAARLDAGDAAAVVGDLEALLAEHPLRERFWLQLMLALHRCGRQGEALRAADRFRHMLRDELGLEPSLSLRDLEARILAHDPTLAPPVSLAGASPGEAARRPPGATVVPAVTSLIGRDADVAQVLDALAPQAVVTITGPGGVGKTRVAEHVAGAAAPRFRDGVVMVELAPVRQAAAVVEVVARALDLQQGQHSSLEDTVADFLASKAVLLVLDNCEHVLDTTGPLVERLRRGCPHLGLLATSRAPLGLAGEHLHLLEPLATPATDSTSAVAGSPAVQLFVERAAAARPGFALDERNAGAVGEICRRLDGLPLAIELAAARVRSLGPEALAERLDRRFSLLGTERGPDGRHQTLRRVVEWSHDLLGPEEREVFAQLSVVAGSFGLAAAEDVCRLGRDASTAGAVADLVEQSMVHLVDPDEPRYVVLETLRELGQERLRAAAGAPEVEARHRDLYVRVAEEAALGLDSAEERTWVARLDRDLDNLRAAHVTAVRAGDLDVAARLVAALREHGFRRIRYEVTALAEATMAMEGFTNHPRAPLTVAVAAYGRWVRGDLPASVERAIAAIELEEATGGPSSGLPERVLGNARFYQGRIEEALTWIDRMVEGARASGSVPRLAHALYMSSVALTSVGEREHALEQAHEAEAVAGSAGCPTARAQVAYALGLALREDDGDAAERWLERSAGLGDEAGNRWIRAFALTEVHWLRAQRGDHEGGLAGLGEVIDTWLRGGDWANLWLSLRHVFGILSQVGEDRSAAVLYGKLLAAGAASALPSAPGDVDRLAEEVELVAARLGRSELDRAVQEGRAMSDTEAVAHVQDRIERLTGRRPLRSWR